MVCPNQKEAEKKKMEKNLAKILVEEDMEYVLERGTRNIGDNFVPNSRDKPVRQVIEALRKHYAAAYLTMHKPYNQDLVCVRLWSGKPTIQKPEGHPDYTLNRDIALVEARVGNQASERLIKGYLLEETVEIVEIPNAIFAPKTEIYRVKKRGGE